MTSTTLIAAALPSIGNASEFSTDEYYNRERAQIKTDPQQRGGYDQSLLEVQISDTRGSLLNTGAISSSTKLTRDDIKKSGARNIDQILQQIPGVQFNRSGGPGTLSTYYLRGSESDTTLVMVNDVRIQSINTGYSLISDLQLDSIESIEVIRGAQSALYGSTAPGGIIKIYTTPQSNQSQASLNNSVSDQGDFKTGLAGSGEIGDFFVFGSGHWLRSDGIDACSLNTACFVPFAESDLDGREQLNGQLGFKMFSDGGQSIQVSQLYTNARQEFDGSFSNESESTQKITNIQWHQPLGRNQKVRVDAGVFNEFFLGLGPQINEASPDDEPADLTTTSATPEVETKFQYGTERYTASLVHELTPETNSGFSFISGLDYDDSTLVDSELLPEVNRRSTGLFGEMQYQENGATVRIGARRDLYREEQPNSSDTKRNYASTGHLKLKLDVTENWAIKTSVGRNFNMPTFTELYYPGFSNDQLGPETHNSQDLGLEYRTNTITSSLFVFRTKSRDLIVFDGANLSSIGEAQIEGIEFSNQYQADGFGIGANITWLDAKNTTGAFINNELPRRPSLQFAGHMSYQFSQTTARIGALASGERFDDQANTRRVAGYTIFDLGFQHQASKALTLGLRIDNLFDKDYETVLGYNQPDRSVWLEMNYAIR